MVSLQSALMPEAASKPRAPCLSLAPGGGAVASTATSKKRKRDCGGDDGRHEEDSRGEVVDWIELNFDAAPLPPEWQRCLDIKSGQIHYYNTRTHKRTYKDPRTEPDYCATATKPAVEEDVDDESSATNCAAHEGLDLELNLNFEPRRVAVNKQEKRPKPLAPDHRRRGAAEQAPSSEDGREMVPAVCVRCHMLVMMCRANPACPNCKFQHPPPSQSQHHQQQAAMPPEAEPEPLKLALRPLCCRD